MKQYEKNFNRVADCVTKRAEFIGRKAVLADIVGQLSIRATVFSHSTVNAEISSIRAVLRQAKLRPDGLWLGETILPQTWYDEANKIRTFDCRADRCCRLRHS